VAFCRDTAKRKTKECEPRDEIWKGIIERKENTVEVEEKGRQY
jgi:hypothetical protein